MELLEYFVGIEGCSCIKEYLFLVFYLEVYLVHQFRFTEAKTIIDFAHYFLLVSLNKLYLKSYDEFVKLIFFQYRLAQFPKLRNCS